MAQVAQTSDNDEWSRGQGEFYIASGPRVTKSYNTGNNTGSESESKVGNRSGYAVYRSENEAAYPDTKNASAIHVDVRPSYPPVDVPIQRISTTGRNWSASSEQRNYVYPSGTIIVSPPAAINSTRRQRRTIRQGSETRVVTKMTIPPLESPSLGRPRNERSYSSDVIRETESRRGQYDSSTLNTNFRQMNINDTIGRSQSTNRRKNHSSRHCSHCRCNKHSRIRSSSRSRARDIYGTVRGMPMTFGYSRPAYAVYPDWAGNYGPAISPAAIFYPEDYATPVTGVPYLASPAIPIQYSLPRRYGPPPSAAMTTLTPGSVARYPQGYPRSAKTPSQYHCVCCPNGAHQSTADRSSRVFNFESDQWESDGLPPVNPTPYGRSTITKRSTSRQQYTETQRLVPQSATPGGRKSRQTPTEFEVPIQKDMPGVLPYGFTSPGGTLNETTYTSQRYQNVWNATMSPKNVGVVSSGEVIRDDGFPADYEDLTKVDFEITNGVETDDEMDYLPTPDKRVVVQLAEAALASGVSPTQVAATLKKSMDENFGPVWHVIAGPGSFGSNIASMKGQLIHFRGFGWAFLIWKTADQQPE